MAFKITALAVLAALPSTLAHGGVLSYLIGGITYKGWTPYNTRAFEFNRNYLTLIAYSCWPNWNRATMGRLVSS
jgi:hypothetical protein